MLLMETVRYFLFVSEELFHLVPDSTRLDQFQVQGQGQRNYKQDIFLVSHIFIQLREYFTHTCKKTKQQQQIIINVFIKKKIMSRKPSGSLKSIDVIIFILRNKETLDSNY